MFDSINPYRSSTRKTRSELYVTGDLVIRLDRVVQAGWQEFDMNSDDYRASADPDDAGFCTRYLIDCDGADPFFLDDHAVPGFIVAVNRYAELT